MVCGYCDWLCSLVKSFLLFFVASSQASPNPEPLHPPTISDWIINDTHSSCDPTLSSFSVSMKVISFSKIITSFWRYTHRPHSLKNPLHFIIFVQINPNLWTFLGFLRGFCLVFDFMKWVCFGFLEWRGNRKLLIKKPFLMLKFSLVLVLGSSGGLKSRLLLRISPLLSAPAASVMSILLGRRRGCRRRLRFWVLVSG